MRRGCTLKFNFVNWGFVCLVSMSIFTNSLSMLYQNTIDMPLPIKNIKFSKRKISTLKELSTLAYPYKPFNIVPKGSPPPTTLSSLLSSLFFSQPFFFVHLLLSTLTFFPLKFGWIWKPWIYNFSPTHHLWFSPYISHFHPTFSPYMLYCSLPIPCGYI